MTVIELGAALKAARKAAKLSMKEVAVACGRSYQWVDNVEGGRREATFEDLSRFAAVIGMRLELELVPSDSPPPARFSARISNLVPALDAFSDAPAETIDSLHRILSACRNASPAAIGAAAALLEMAAGAHTSERAPPAYGEADGNRRRA